jgi:hypothetical protein
MWMGFQLFGVQDKWDIVACYVLLCLCVFVMQGVCRGFCWYLDSYFCKWVELWNLGNYSWFSLIVLVKFVIDCTKFLIILFVVRQDCGVCSFKLCSGVGWCDLLCFGFLIYVLKFCNSLKSWIPRRLGPWS